MKYWQFREMQDSMFIRVTKDSYMEYACMDHRDPERGYRNPAIALSAAFEFSKIILASSAQPSRVTLLAVDRSTLTLAVATRFFIPSLGLEFHHKWARKWEPYAHVIPASQKVVMCDDAVCSGDAVRCAAKLLGRNLDLVLCIYGNHSHPNHLPCEEFISLRENPLI